MVLDLHERVLRLREVFDLSSLEHRGETSEDIKSYYESSRFGYKLFHSREGSIHMSLSSGAKYEPTGVYRVLDLIEERLHKSTRNVLEVGAGAGFNLRNLAMRNPDMAFTGIDLVPSHVRAAARLLARIPNASMVEGDFEDLHQLSTGRFEAVLAIESLCHARNLAAALSEIRRVLADGGGLIVVDAWRTDIYAKSGVDVQEAVSFTERAMSVGSAATQGDWMANANACGLRLVERLPLNAQVMPNLERFEAGAELALAQPELLKLASRFVPRRLLENIVAGYLMASTVRCGLHTYDLLQFKRI